MATKDPLRPLLERIVAEPDDASLRRVYADVLTQRGDPRGAFIQLQCALADQLAHDDPRRAALEFEAARLQRRHFQAWVRPIVTRSRKDVTFVRGFVERWQCGAADFVERGPRAAARTPLRALELVGFDTDALWQRLLRLPAFATMQTLRLIRVRRWPFAALAAVADMPRVERLQLAGHPRGEAGGLGLLAQLPWFNRLRELELLVPITERDGEALGDSEGFGRLTRLTLGGAVVPVGEAASMLELRLRGLGTSQLALNALLRRAPRLASLSLELARVVRGARLTPLGALAFDPATLTTLAVEGALLRDGFVEQVLASPRLESLTLRQCQLTSAMQAQLSAHLGTRLVHEQCELVTTPMQWLRRLLQR